MTVFSIEETRRHLLAEYGLPLIYDSSTESFRKHRALANAAMIHLGSAVQCILVDFLDDAKRLLDLCIERFALAAEIDEPADTGEEEFQRGFRLEQLALSRWLRNGTHDAERLRAAVVHYREYVRSRPKPRLNHLLLLNVLLDARDYQGVLDHFHQYPRFKIPKSPRRIGSDQQLIYWVAASRLGRADVLETTLRSYLHVAVPRDLSTGQYSEVARWMKILYGDGQASFDASCAAVRRTLEFLVPSDSECNLDANS